MRVVCALALAGWSAWVAAQTSMLALPIGTPVPLLTVEPLSSKTSAKGDMVALRTAADVSIDGTVVIPAGTPAVGQIADARAKGAMGMSGRLAVRPLYLQVEGRIVRLAGKAVDKGSVTAGAVIGTVALGAPVFTGRSAKIPPGSRVDAIVERTVELPPAASGRDG